MNIQVEEVFYDSFIRRRFSISKEPIVLHFNDYKDVYIRMIGLMLISNIYLKFFIFSAPGEIRFFIGFILLLFLWMIYAIISDKKTTDKFSNFVG